MIIVWAAQGKPHYVSEDGNIPYISDIGADILKPLFIAVCSVTAVCFVLALILERWLRHRGRLLPNMRRRERVFSVLSIIGCLIGGVGLILLSIFDTKRHMKAHRGFLLIFMVGVALSALFTILEFRWLNKAHARRSRRLKLSYIAKGIIAGILVLLAIAFGACLARSVNDPGAILEWVIAFGFTFFLLTFVFDLVVMDDVSFDEYQQNLWNGRPMVQR